MVIRTARVFINTFVDEENPAQISVLCFGLVILMLHKLNYL